MASGVAAVDSSRGPGEQVGGLEATWRGIPGFSCRAVRTARRPSFTGQGGAAPLTTLYEAVAENEDPVPEWEGGVGHLELQPVDPGYSHLRVVQLQLRAGVGEGVGAAGQGPDGSGEESGEEEGPGDYW